MSFGLTLFHPKLVQSSRNRICLFGIQLIHDFWPFKSLWNFQLFYIFFITKKLLYHIEEIAILNKAIVMARGIVTQSGRISYCVIVELVTMVEWRRSRARTEKHLSPFGPLSVNHVSWTTREWTISTILRHIVSYL